MTICRCWFINLATVREPSLVIPVIAEEVGLKDLGQQSLIDMERRTAELLDTLKTEIGRLATLFSEEA